MINNASYHLSIDRILIVSNLRRTGLPCFSLIVVVRGMNVFFESIPHPLYFLKYTFFSLRKHYVILVQTYFSTGKKKVIYYISNELIRKKNGGGLKKKGGKEGKDNDINGKNAE